MTTRTSADWARILESLGVKPLTFGRWADAFAAEVHPDRFSLGEAEIDDWLANVLHESAMLESLSENLNYSTDALISLFGRHRISIEDAQKYGRNASHPANQRGVANSIYGGPWGRENLGNVHPDDGWDYRGAGLIQVTGRANFAYLQKVTGLPLLENPDILRKPGPAAISVAIAWWEGKIPDSVIGNIPRTRKAVNGGNNGLAHVTDLTGKAGDALA